jgi:hypothetical protein
MQKKTPTELQKSKLPTNLTSLPPPKQSIQELGKIQNDLIDTISRTPGPDGLHIPS